MTKSAPPELAPIDLDEDGATEDGAGAPQGGFSADLPPQGAPTQAAYATPRDHPCRALRRCRPLPCIRRLRQPGQRWSRRSRCPRSARVRSGRLCRCPAIPIDRPCPARRPWASRRS